MKAIRKIQPGERGLLSIAPGDVSFFVGGQRARLRHHDVELVFLSSFDAVLDGLGQAIIVAAGSRAFLLWFNDLGLRLLPKAGGYTHYVDCLVEGSLEVEVELRCEDLWLWEGGRAGTGEGENTQLLLDYSPDTRAST